MKYKRLLAKSGGRYVAGAPRTGGEQTIREHTAFVMDAAQALWEATGRRQLEAVGLDPKVWLERFRRHLLAAALLHDLGKASSSYQAMLAAAIAGRPPVKQAIRHEAISYLIARTDEIRDWLRPFVGETDDLELILWAVAGHHRKFPPDRIEPGTGLEIMVYLTHPSFREVLELGVDRFKIAPAPVFTEDLKLSLGPFDSVIDDFRNAEVEAAHLMEGLSDDRRRFVAVLKACLICADSAGSIGPQGDQSVSAWVVNAFTRAPTPSELNRIVRKRLEASNLTSHQCGTSAKTELQTEGKRPAKSKRLRKFQREIGRSTTRVTFVRAGCGSGKTIGAYHWAARQAQGRRLFFCYPTTGTSTEGFRDYLTDPSLDSDLVHCRAHVDLELMRLKQIQGEQLDLGEDEPDAASPSTAQTSESKAGVDVTDVVKQWSSSIVSCTVDSVLGLVQNNRRGVLAWPSIAGSACVFDEIHSYDDRLFEALVRFLVDVKGIPCLLMTASLPEARKQRLEQELAKIREELGRVDGPRELERHPRYQRLEQGVEWDLVEAALDRKEKVLWVVNRVDRALNLASDSRAISRNAKVYHSRFCYVDRLRQHNAVIEAFDDNKPGPALAITTQVAEMSLDISADLLVTDLCPIPALIQRLGRLNRRATPKNRGIPRPFFISLPKLGGGALPYKQNDIEAARSWLDGLGQGVLSQRDLVLHWRQDVVQNRVIEHPCNWLDGGFFTIPNVLREGMPGFDIIRECDRDQDPAMVRIPMPRPRGKLEKEWMSWPEHKFCKIPPDEAYEYDRERGASWNQ